MEVVEEKGPPQDTMEVEDEEEVLEDGTIHKTHKVHRRFRKPSGKKSLISGESDLTEVAETLLETYEEPPRTMSGTEEEEIILDDGTRVTRKVITSSLVQKFRTRACSFDESGNEISSDEYEIEEVLPGTQSCFIAKSDKSLSSSSSSFVDDLEEVEANLEEEKETYKDGTQVQTTYLQAKETRKSRSRSGSLERTEDTYTIRERRITPSHTPRSGSPVPVDDAELTNLEAVSKTTRTGHYESTTHKTKEAIESTSDLKTEEFIPQGALKESPKDEKDVGTEGPKSCDTFVALPPVTANGCVIFGKNSDRPPYECQEVVYHKAAQFEAGAKLQCTYIEIPQAPKTQTVILSKPAWMWGAEMGANEPGVCIGNEAVWTQLADETDLTERLLGMDFVRLGLERGTTARESLDVITSLLEEYGQGGSCYEEPAEVMLYHNSFIIADSTEAWVLETAGKYWAAERITEGVRNISNQLSITTKMDLTSSNLIADATSLGLYKADDGDFNFAKVFGKPYSDPSRVVSARSRFTCGEKLLKDYSKGEGVRNISNQLSITTKMDLNSPNLIEEAKLIGLYKAEDGEFNFAKVFGKDFEVPTWPESTRTRFACGKKLLKDYSKGGNFSVKDMMKILRDVDSGICMADKTKGSQVSVLSPGASASPCCHWLTGTRNPSTSLFKPFIFGPNPDIGKITMSPDYGENDPRKIIPRFQKKVDRGHELYKGHEKLVEVLGRDDPMGHMVLENMRELENNCIADMEEILSSYTEESFRKVAGMFKHMCDIEMNFYKMLPSESPKSCDTLVALPPATANGCVVFGKNSDRPGQEVQEVIYQAAAEHEPGTKLQCTYIEIEQAPKTLAVILSKPAWMWGAEMGANDAGVCIGNEAVWTTLNSDDDLKERLLGMDLLRLGLERGSTAKESLDVIISLLTKYGQGGTCVEGGQWSYHNSFLIADRSEAWVLETAGNKYWAAEKVTEGVRNISNQLSITTKMDVMSPNLIEEATAEKLYKPEDGPFNFAKVFSEFYIDPAKSFADRFSCGRRLLKEYSKDGTFGPKDMMKILRDDDSGINMGTGTTGSQVSVIPPATSGAPCCHWMTATPDPSVCMFKPFIFGDNPRIGNFTVSPDYGDEDPRKLKPRFQKRVDRRHELYKEHDKLFSLIRRGDKGKEILKNIQELENNCIGDIEEIMKSYGEQSFSKVANIFEHMCDIEMNFYK